MMKALTVFGLLMIWLGACRQNEETIIDANGVAAKLPHMWKTSISNNGKLAEVVSEAKIVVNSQFVIVGGNRDNTRQLISIDSESGKAVWAWSDLLGLRSDPTYPDPVSVDEDKYHVYQNKWVFQLGSSTYCVNVESGSTFWKHKVNLNRFDNCSGIGNMFFNSGSNNELNLGQQLYVGQIVGNSIEQPVVRPVYDFTEVDESSPLTGLIWRILPFEQNSEIMLAILFSDPPKTGRRYPTAMGLYNFTQRKWVYERATLNGSYPDSNVSWAKLHNGKVYHTSTRSMQCHDLMTGKEIWSVSFSQGFALSGFIVQDGKIFANNGDRFTYCLNPETGRQIWKEESSGSASPISYLNGVLYFMGGGDGRLHAIDANTGKHLWRLRSPDVDKNSGAFFYGICVAVPGQGGKKGRIVATTGLNAYGYEAIR